jgi:membrane protease subunit HflK
MAWKNQGGGPWGSGPKGPWGSGPQSSGPTPPDLEDLLRRGQDKLQSLLPGGHFSTMGVLIAILIAAVIWGLSGFFRVQPNELGVVLRFGKYVRTVQPGLNYHLPYPIETVLLPEALRVRSVSIGMRVTEGRGGTTMRDVPEESLMLTGDENIVDIEFAVLWQIKDVFKYAFDVRNPEENVRAGAEAAMREVIGKSNLQFAQTEGRSRIEQDTKDLLQRMLDEYGLGARISQIQLLRVDPPQEVIAAFRDVQAARADKERLINEGNTYRNQQLPRAKGEAESIVQRAEAYKAEIVARASGDAQRFTQVYEQYAKAKDITTERLYLDTMEEVLRNVNKVLVDKNTSGTGGVLPYLPLPELRSGQPAAPSGSGSRPPQQPLPGATR